AAPRHRNCQRPRPRCPRARRSLRRSPSGAGSTRPGRGDRCADDDVRRGRRVRRRRRGGGRVSRKADRRTALFHLYQWDVTGQPLTSLYEGDVDEWSRTTAEEVAADAAELERLSESEDADKALDILTELADLSRKVEEELQRAKRDAEADAQA